MPDISENQLLFLVFLISIVINFGLSLVIYAKKFGLFRRREERFLGITTFGFIEDAVVIPFVNVLALSLLLDNGLLPTKNELLVFLAAGLGFSFIVHLLFSIKNWEIWLMEEPWKWNLAGKWHIVSLALQMSYLFFVGFALLTNDFTFDSRKEILKILTIFLLLLIFALLFIKNSEGIKLGRVRIKNRTW